MCGTGAFLSGHPTNVGTPINLKLWYDAVLHSYRETKWRTTPSTLSPLAKWSTVSRGSLYPGTRSVSQVTHKLTRGSTFSHCQTHFLLGLCFGYLLAR